jgi:2-(1,2-epoxy-1,2-dihydrophenyl)acetyl-CoA isomerase
MSDDLLLEKRDGNLLTVTLNRAERRNAMSPEMNQRLVEVLERAAVDRTIGAVLLNGAGGTFCVGGDVKAMAAGRDAATDTFSRIADLRRKMEASRLLHEMAKPTIAAIDGAAAGAGLSLALACDIRIAAFGAKITTAFAKVGLAGDFGGSWFLTHLVGSAKARELYLTSPVLTGKEAYALGVVTRAVPDEQLQSAALELARSLADGPRVTLSYIKQNLNAAQTGTLAASLDIEARHHILSSLTEDHREAANAFVEKRQPSFKGR